MKTFLIIASLVFLDLISKYLIYDLHFWNNFYLITPILNTGISWWIKILHFNILVIVIPLILIWIIYLYKKNEIWYYPFLLIFAWWVANFIDRLMYHWVRDFIDFHFFPVFNIADIFVSIWVFLLFYEIFFPKKNKI